MTENLNQEKQKVIEIYPVKVGRRVLAFLAEIFVCLILSIILFELCVFQISRLVIGYDKLVEDSETYQKGQYNILYQHELLYFDDTKQLHQINRLFPSKLHHLHSDPISGSSVPPGQSKSAGLHFPT